MFSLNRYVRCFLCEPHRLHYLWKVIVKQCWHVDKSMRMTPWLDTVNTTNVYEWEIGSRDVTKRLTPPTGDILQRVRVRHDNIDKSLATRLPSCRTFIADTLDFQLKRVFESEKKEADHKSIHIYTHILISPSISKENVQWLKERNSNFRNESIANSPRKENDSLLGQN